VLQAPGRVASVEVFLGLASLITGALGAPQFCRRAARSSAARLLSSSLLRH
jgi:hypothetical protein